MRLFSVEILLREELREFLKDSDFYERRRNLQVRLAGVLSGVAIAAIWFVWRLFRVRWKSQRDRWSGLALLAGLAMCALVILRMISWHTTDWLLYGPFKLNWVVDLGLASLIGFCAMRYSLRTRQRGSKGH